MKKLSISCLSLIICACSYYPAVNGNGQITSETRNILGFDKVELSGAYQLNMTTNCPFGLKITGDSNLMSYTQTKVEDNTLEIGSQNDTNLRLTQPIVIDLCMPKLTNFSASGANAISLNMRNAKDSKLKVELSGANQINLQGSINTLKLETSGDINFSGKNATINHADIESSGNSKITITVLQDLKVDASGSSSIQYYGSPTSLKISLSGSGSVTQGH